MAENYKRLYETTKKMLTQYQDEVVPELRRLLDERVEVVRCKDCNHWLKDVAGCTDNVGRCEWANYMVGADGYCVYGERRESDA